MHNNQHGPDTEVDNAHRCEESRQFAGDLNTYSAIPIVSRQRLVSIHLEAVSILIVRQRLMRQRNKFIQRKYALQEGGSVLRLTALSAAPTYGLREASRINQTNRYHYRQGSALPEGIPRLGVGNAVSPTQRSVAHIRSQGYLVAIVEHWNSFTKRRKDLFQFADLLAVKDGITLAVQTTSGSNMAARSIKLAGYRRLWPMHPRRLACGGSRMDKAQCETWR